MAKYRWAIAAALVSSMVCMPVMATEVGDEAPPLKIKEWVKGGPVELKKGDHIYVVEFWATWCGPCLKSIPHLTELQKKYKDKGVIVIGVSDEKVSKVRPFVEKKGSQMDYVVAVDDGRQTARAYLQAFGVRGIPHAFIVGKSGKILWHGNPADPNDKIDQIVEEVVAGKFDLARAKETEKARKRVEKAMKLFPQYFTLASQDEKSDEMKKLGKKIFKNGRSNAMLMTQFAWIIMDDKRIKHRDLKLAKKAAKAAFEVDDGKNAMILNTYARALFETGDVKEALEHQKKAVELCDNPRLMTKLKESLEKYQKALADKEA
ncbi:MAG: TlpA family protein disulfide reductase [Phycisphaerales bacterium]|nr:TlpA family protein disulfide reductase [Phycisphaerales bacterium]